MEKYDVSFKKRYGQNFLKDVNVVKKIVRVADMDSDSLVIEVGPGGAIMTRELASFASYVLAYEIDQDLKEELSKRLADCFNVQILFQDFLQSNLSDDVSKYSYSNLFFVSNVPYYITTPIIMKLMHSGLSFKKIVMMVQKEVGIRFSASCGCKDYGSITVLLQYFYEIKREFLVSRNQFVPIPNVDSVVVSFSQRENRPEVRDFSFFETLVRDSFQYKRKTLKNNLHAYDWNKVALVLEKYSLPIDVRAEMLSVDVFVDLANTLI